MRYRAKGMRLIETGRMDLRALPPGHPDRRDDLAALFDAVEHFFRDVDLDTPTHPDPSIDPIWQAYKACAE